MSITNNVKDTIMALESVVGSVNQNYIAQQKNESSISKKENTQDIMPQEVIEDIDYSNMDKGAFGSEVKELLEQFNNGTLTTENLQAKVNIWMQIHSHIKIMLISQKQQVHLLKHKLTSLKHL